MPGMHLIGVKAEVAERHPWLPDELSRLIDASQRLWIEKRRKYAETTPWIIDELLRSTQDLPKDWNDSGLAANRTMIEQFARELHVQGIVNQLLSPDDLFPLEARDSTNRRLRGANRGEHYDDQNSHCSAFLPP